MVQSLIQVIYVGGGEPGLREYEIATLLKQARIANRKHNVSGLLLYIGGYFLQSFEGEPRMIDVVCSTLFRDKPRMWVKRIVQEPIVERQFPEWTMGFATIDSGEAGQLLGDETLFQSTPVLTHLTADGAKTLISIFGQRRYQSDRSGMFKAIRRPA
jgi:hypothetical protein